MQTDVRKIYEINKKLVGAVDRAVCLFRIGRYDKALKWVADTADDINIVADAVMQDREYFDNVSTGFVEGMLSSIVEATVAKDYCLLADIYEMQLSTFVCGVQELILGREQFLEFDNNRYRENITHLKSVLREMIEERDDLTVDEQKRFNFIKGDAEGLVNLPQQIKGLKLSISLREDTEKDKVIEVQHNVYAYRPYSRMYQLTGTEGFANKYPTEGISVKGINGHTYVPQEVMDSLLTAYRPEFAKAIEEQAKSVGGHGGMDFIMDYRLIYCLRHGLPLDEDVYDAAEWSAVQELSRISLENNSMPVRFPDFTRGDWNKVDGFHYAM